MIEPTSTQRLPSLLIQNTSIVLEELHDDATELALSSLISLRHSFQLNQKHAFLGSDDRAIVVEHQEIQLGMNF